MRSQRTIRAAGTAALWLSATSSSSHAAVAIVDEDANTALLLEEVVRTSGIVRAAAIARREHYRAPNPYDFGPDQEEEEEEEERPVEYEKVGVAICRRNPTWRMEGAESDDNDGGGGGGGVDNIVRERCHAALMGDQPPLDVEWLTAGKHPHLSSHYDVERGVDDATDYSEGYDDLPVMERPLLRTLAECMDSKAADDAKEEKKGENNEVDTNNGTEGMPMAAVERFHLRHGKGTAALVSHVLSDEEANGVLNLSACVRTHVPYLFEHREFELADADSGGNDVVYMAGFLQLLLPGVAAQLKRVLHMVWEEATWGEREKLFKPVDWIPNDDADEGGTTEYSTQWWPNPITETGIRTTEHLSYDRWGSLGYHQDHGSDYTVLVALSHPSDYEGGEFMIKPSKSDGDKVNVKPERLSAVVFLSEIPHGVEEILSPGRAMFATEYWRYGDVPAMGRRPTEETIVFGDPENQFQYERDEGSSEDGSSED